MIYTFKNVILKNMFSILLNAESFISWCNYNWPRCWDINRDLEIMIEDNTSPSFMDSFGKHLYMGLLQFAILMHIKQLKDLYCLWKSRRWLFLNVYMNLK